MSRKKTYLLVVALIVGTIGLYLYNKYNVAPKITLANIDVVTEHGTRFDFNSLKGQKVIVSFYASWCGNCLTELATLHHIKTDKLNDITVLAITDEPIEKLIAFKTKKQYPFTFLKLNQSFHAMGIFSIPTIYLLNTQGEIVYKHVGNLKWEDASTLHHLKALMK